MGNKQTWVFNGKHYHDFDIEELEKNGWNFNPTKEDIEQFILTNEDYEQLAKETETLLTHAAEESEQPLE